MASLQVVVGVDSSVDGRAALYWALQFAAERDAAVTLVHAWLIPPSATGSTDLLVDALEDAGRSVLDAETREAGKAARVIVVTPRLEYGPPAAAILAADENADIVVVGSRGRGQIAGLVLGSVSQAVVTSSTRPVVVVKNSGATVPDGSPATSKGTVVVAVDDSVEGRAALRWGTEHALDTGRPLRVLHAFQPRHLAGVLGIADLQPDVQWRAEAQRVLADLVADEVGDEVPADAPIETIVAKDDPPSAVLRAARDADLVVIGSRGRGRAVSALFGSVSSAVLRDAPCPVVVVPRPSGHEDR